MLSKVLHIKLWSQTQVCDMTVLCSVYALYTPQPGMHQMNTNVALYVMGMKTGS